MKNQGKRILSLILACVLLVSLPIVPTAQASSTQELTLDQPATAVISTGGEYAYFTFTPQTNGRYEFISDSTSDTYAYLYESDILINSDDDSGTGNNFKISTYLQAGVTYTLRVKFYSSSLTGEFPVSVSVNPIARISVQPLTIKENTNGYWNNDVFIYNLTGFTYTVEFTDGTILSNITDTTFTYGNTQYSYTLSWNGNSYSNPFVAGNTYAITFSLNGSSTIAYVNIEPANAENGFYYQIENNSVTITGSSRSDTNLVIPETLCGIPVTKITSLGNASQYAESLTIPNSVTSIEFSLYGWYNLKVLNIGSSLVSDISELFYYSYSLEAINVDSGNPNYTSIDGVLYNADQTKILWCSPKKTGSYVMPDSVDTINQRAFYKSSLTSITVSPNVTSLVYATFAGSAKLENVILPEGLQSIGNCAFADCTSLKVAQIPSTVTTIAGAYSNCNSLEQVHIVDLAAWCRIQFYGTHPLYYAHDLYLDGTKIEHLEIPSTVTDISANAFCYGSMTSLSVPSNVNSIGYQAFSYSDIKTAEFSEGCTAINDLAFYRSDLETIKLPNSLLSLGDSTFENCYALTNVTLGNRLTNIPSRCFASTNSLKTLDIPESVNYIGTEAFYDSGIVSTALTGNNVYVGQYAFAGSNLDYIDLSGVSGFEDGYHHLDGGKNFANTNLVSVEIPSTVTAISYRCFAFNEDLLSVVIPESVTSIPYSFDHSDNVEHVFYEGTQAQWEALDTVSALPADAKYHFEATGKDLTVEYTCTEIHHYCAICDQLDIIQRKTPMHNYAGTFVWNNQHTTCSYNVRCPDCNDQQNINCDVIVLESSPQKRTYQATAIFEGKTYTDIAVVSADTPALPEIDANAPQITLESKTVVKGNAFTVTAEVKNNPGFCYLEVTPMIPSAFTLVNVENGELISDLTTGRQYVWIADQDIAQDGVLLTFTFLAEETVAAGNYQVSLAVRTCGNYDEEPVTLYSAPANIEVIDYIYGDATGDNVVDGFDLIRIKKYLANYDYDTGSSSIEINMGADANGDGKIDGFDAIRLKKYLANYDYETGESTIVLGP